MTRIAVVLVMIVFVLGFGFLTLSVVAEQGVTAGTVLSVFILILLTIGIVGSLRDPPRR